MKTATAKQKLPSAAPLDNASDQSTNSLKTGQLLGNNSNQAIQTEHTPLFGVCGPEASQSLPTTLTHNKLPESIILPIDSIEFDGSHPVDAGLKSQIATSVKAPWGKLMVPIVVSKLDSPHDGKQWLLRKGLHRLLAAEEIGLPEIRAVVVGSEEETRLLLHELDMVRKHPSKYEEVRQYAEWLELIQHIHEAYKPGGDKKKKATQKLPPLGQLIEKTTGLKKSAFYGKVQTYQGLIPGVRQYLDEHPHCATAKKEVWLRDLAKKYSPEQQEKLAPYLKKLSNPNDAYFQAMRDEAVEKAKSLPHDNLFPIYHEDFRENAKRIEDGTVNLIATDPNWHLADDSEKDEMWTLHGIPVAPQLTVKDWHDFGSLAAQKLAKDGLAAILVGVQNAYEIETILRQYLRWRWVVCYLLTSGSGTVCRRSGFTSHYRMLLIFERKDAPERAGTYKQFVHDVLPNIPKSSNTPETLIGLLKIERAEVEKRIVSLEADDTDLYLDDLLGTIRVGTDAVKTWHPWAQELSGWRAIIRRFSKAGDFIWEPFAGSGTTAIAAVTCTERHFVNGKQPEVKAPRRGIGCDGMECWAKVAKVRLWEEQHSKVLLPDKKAEEDVPDPANEELTSEAKEPEEDDSEEAA